EVTRLGPSPTGYLHTGHLFGAMIDKFVADKTNGVYYLRLEDTDQVRKIDEAGKIAYQMLCKFNTAPVEGYMGDGRPQVGEYGSYIQSERTEIYNAFAKRLVELGRAFPCFCKSNAGKESVKERREKQIEETGNIIDHDPCRALDIADIDLNLKMGRPWALKLLSTGDPDKTYEFVDLIKGKRELHENCKDVVLMKSNGIPPYAFAHVVDDTLMHTTIVVRGEDWWPSLPSHLEIFNALGIKPPKYAHTPNISKIDAKTGNKRKLSKRYDPEADVRYFLHEGYPIVAINEYLLNLLNSDFESWRKANPTLAYTDFPFSLNKISSSNPMFDMVKINDIAKNIISTIPAKQLLRNIVDWANEYDTELAKVLLLHQSYAEKLLAIDRENDRPRKDIAHYSEFKSLYNYMFDEYYDMKDSLNFDPKYKKQDIVHFLKEYLSAYSSEDNKQDWFDRLKAMALSCGYVDMKTYKANPDAYIGSVADASNIIRFALTGRTNTPDLYEIMKLMGVGEVNQRLNYVINKLK
ncbi:MAG: glutamate--tRNA ligase, partial [Clostridia bacterium]|nr:glutamate--tRNA ligase [Clostridia bacterium]